MFGGAILIDIDSKNGKLLTKLFEVINPNERVNCYREFILMAIYSCLIIPSSNSTTRSAISRIR
ncbi:hypothetical protein C8R27_103120 [Nitrosomonas ureae]|nr:hypothetical protein C8R27_103120 [Nitrosomonas ureae]